MSARRVSPAARRVATRCSAARRVAARRELPRGRSYEPPDVRLSSTTMQSAGCDDASAWQSAWAVRRPVGGRGGRGGGGGGTRPASGPPSTRRARYRSAPGTCAGIERSGRPRRVAPAPRLPRGSSATFGSRPAARVHGVDVEQLLGGDEFRDAVGVAEHGHGDAAAAADDRRRAVEEALRVHRKVPTIDARLSVETPAPAVRRRGNRPKRGSAPAEIPTQESTALVRSAAGPRRGRSAQTRSPPRGGSPWPRGSSRTPTALKDRSARARPP